MRLIKNGDFFFLISKILYFCFGKSRNELDMAEKETPITDNQEKIARYGKALSNPTRVFILEYLANNLNKCCYSGDMAEILPIARSTLSEHLKELKNAGLIQGEINPPYIKYCINPENWEEAKLLFARFFKK
jgi:DNA-binding HxlR family transcriptional regulator